MMHHYFLSGCNEASLGCYPRECSVAYPFWRKKEMMVNAVKIISKLATQLARAVSLLFLYGVSCYLFVPSMAVAFNESVAY